MEVKGQVFGVVVRSRGLAGNILAGLRSLGGGEIIEYTQMLEEARRHAIDRMVKNAHRMGGNAVVMMRFDSSEMGQTMSEIVAYGTAVVVEKLPPQHHDADSFARGGGGAVGGLAWGLDSQVIPKRRRWPCSASFWYWPYCSSDGAIGRRRMMRAGDG
ncbi:YbjQ family protein [Variovorax rhizosphaerae]|uniref:Heavy metal-binding domain-containing protein n=1 Tax=Variovorax rhizosphaerae TaxID=1836200 RepID=A0ABU8X1M7_9BURK